MSKGNKEFTQEIFDAIKDPSKPNLYGESRHIIEVIASIIELRMKSGLTQEQFAEKAGIAQSSIARLESGRSNPTLRHLIKLAHALGCKVRITK